MEIQHSYKETNEKKNGFFNYNQQDAPIFDLFYVLLTVYISLIPVINQTDAQNLILIVAPCIS